MASNDRAEILSAVAALQEFTVPQLGAYVRASAGTCYRVMRGLVRDGLVCSAHGRDPVVWRVADGQLDAILSEVAAGGQLPELPELAGPASEPVLAPTPESIERGCEPDDAVSRRGDYA